MPRTFYKIRNTNILEGHREKKYKITKLFCSFIYCKGKTRLEKKKKSPPPPPNPPKKKKKKERKKKRNVASLTNMSC